jgi:hypothetical protein
MIFLISTAFAGILYSEEELTESCTGLDSNCAVITGEVIDAGCRGVSEDDMGAVLTSYTATIQVLDDVHGLGEEVIVLHTSNWDFSNAEATMSCYETDPGHPIGEVATYYLYTGSEEEIYTLYAPESFFISDSSDGDSDPLCDTLPFDEMPDNIEIQHDDLDADNDPKTGCQMLSPVGIFPMLLSGMVLFGRRRDM